MKELKSNANYKYRNTKHEVCSNLFDRFKLQNKLNILNEEYKMLINQKIKEMASCNNSIQREIIENTYKELENEKMQKNQVELY